MDPTAKMKEDSSESEEEEKEETLNEKIDRLASESSEGDEDFDVSGQVSCLMLVYFFFIHPGRYH